MPRCTVLTPAQRGALFALPLREPDLIRRWTLDGIDLAGRRRRWPGTPVVLWNTVHLGRVLDPLWPATR